MALARTRGRAGGDVSLRQHPLAAGFLLLALLCGGAGSYYPLLQLLLELGAIGLILHGVRSYPMPVANPAFRVMLLLFVAAAALLLAQMVPLPADAWQKLPARETSAAIFRQLGWSDRWHAASLTPDLTLRMLLTLLPPLAAFLAAAGGGAHVRLLFFRIIVVTALVSTLFAALQVAAGQDAFTLYNTAHRGSGVGFFVNRNHQATFLLIAMLLCAVPQVLPVGRTPGKSAIDGRQVATLAAIGFLALGVLATTSRTALIILPLALLAAVALAVDLRHTRRWLAGCALLYIVAGAALYPTSLVQRPLARMATASEDLRQQYWDNSLYLIGQSMPWGTGFGSFDTVYRAAEPLAQVSPLVVNNAHNDYLEHMLEGGLPAALLTVLTLIVTVGCLIRAWRASADRRLRAQSLAALGGLTIIILFSVVDYPLRMTALSVVAAILAACAISPASRTRPAGKRPWTRPAGFIVAGLAAIMVIGNGLSTALVQRRLAAPATLLAPWSSAAWTLRANQAQVAGDFQDARAAGLRALAIAPMDVAALRAVASASLAVGQTDQGLHLFEMAAALGWRDRPTQLWLIDQAARTGNLSLAAERVDALLRQGIMGDALLAQMRAIFLAPTGDQVVADRFADRPPWRQGFFNALANDGPAAAPQLLRLMDAARRAGAPVTAEETALIRWRLVETGDIAAARALWSAAGGRALTGDGGFETLSQPPAPGAAPFVWKVPTLAGVRVLAADGGAHGSRRSLIIISDGYAGGVALAQTILLEPGRYRLDAAIRSESGPGARPTLAIACGTDAARPIAAVSPALPGSEWVSASLSVTVPAACPAQTIAVLVPRTSGQPLRIGIDDVAMTRLGR